MTNREIAARIYNEWKSRGIGPNSTPATYQLIDGIAAALDAKDTDAADRERVWRKLYEAAWAEYEEVRRYSDKPRCTDPERCGCDADAHDDVSRARKAHDVARTALAAADAGKGVGCGE